MKQYTGLDSDGTHLAVTGIDAPVPGLAIVEVPPCKCGADLYGVLHVRSGSGLFFAHDPADFGADVWAALSRVDWTRSAEEIAEDPAARTATQAAFALVLGAFYGVPTEPAGDVPDYDGR